jgi:hypothetical protein
MMTLYITFLVLLWLYLRQILITRQLKAELRMHQAAAAFLAERERQKNRQRL